MRIFNTAGPINPEDHYHLPALERFDLFDIELLIAQKKYFVLHAPRQTGKTSALLALQDYLNQQGQYQALYFNVEPAQSARQEVEQAMQSILGQIGSQARRVLSDSYVESIWSTALTQYGGHGALNHVLTKWAEKSAKPLVLLIDEIDSLVGDTLIAVLRQLRAGYTNRPHHFPASVILCGVRDVRDYRMHFSGKDIITGGSAFNIKAESWRLGNFSQDEVEQLLVQHTKETGQVFEPEALELVWELTRGQPWLVNALAYDTCFRIKSGRDRSKPITAKMIIDAKERMILRRETHLDQLVDKLKEARVRRVIEPILRGTNQPDIILEDDILYCYDLGLITLETGQIEIANPIYAEVIPRALTYSTQVIITHQTAWYVGTDGRLQMDKLLTAFQKFFRENSEHWVQRFREYHEAGPQLLLQAFLQRIINGGGQIQREYGLGRGRTDLLVIWPVGEEVQKVVIELKLRYGKLEKTIKEGLKQTYLYMDRSNTEHGHLIIFDRSQNRSWDEKIFTKSESYKGKEIKIWGM